MDYELWAEAWPDSPSFSAWITAVKAEVPIEGWFQAVGQVTCVPRGQRDRMPEMVEDLFRVAVDLPDEDGVYVRLTWLEAPPPAFLAWLEE